MQVLSFRVALAGIERVKTTHWMKQKRPEGRKFIWNGLKTKTQAHDGGHIKVN